LVLPEIILDSAVGFWADWIQNQVALPREISITDENGILKKNNIKKLLEKLNLHKDKVRWDSLIDVADGDRDIPKYNKINTLKKSNKQTSDDEDTEDYEDDL